MCNDRWTTLSGTFTLITSVPPACRLLLHPWTVMLNNTGRETLGFMNYRAANLQSQQQERVQDPFRSTDDYRGNFWHFKIKISAINPEINSKSFYSPILVPTSTKRLNGLLCTLSKYDINLEMGLPSVMFHRLLLLLLRRGDKSLDKMLIRDPRGFHGAFLKGYID